MSGRSSASAQTPASERVQERSRVSDAHRRSPHSRAVANAGTCLARVRQCGRRSSAPVSWTPTTSKHARAESSSVLRASETAGPPVESSHDHANAQLHAHGARQRRLQRDQTACSESREPASSKRRDYCSPAGGGVDLVAGAAAEFEESERSDQAEPDCCIHEPGATSSADQADSSLLLRAGGAAKQQSRSRGCRGDDAEVSFLAGRIPQRWVTFCLTDLSGRY